MQNILVSIDFSAATDGVLSAAGQLARKTPSRIVVVNSFQAPIFLDPPATVVNQAAVAEEKSIAERLEHIRASFESDGIEAKAQLLFGNPGSAIVQSARQIGAGYVVLGSQGHGALRHLLLGSTTLFVLKHSPCPVLVVPVNCSRETDSTNSASSGHVASA